jgi:hypothetical protein
MGVCWDQINFIRRLIWVVQWRNERNIERQYGRW